MGGSPHAHLGGVGTKRAFSAGSFGASGSFAPAAAAAGLFVHIKKTAGISIRESLEESEAVVSFEVGAGALILCDYRTAHRGLENSSPRESRPGSQSRTASPPSPTTVSSPLKPGLATQTSLLAIPAA